MKTSSAAVECRALSTHNGIKWNWWICVHIQWERKGATHVGRLLLMLDTEELWSIINRLQYNHWDISLNIYLGPDVSQSSTIEGHRFDWLLLVTPETSYDVPDISIHCSSGACRSNMYSLAPRRPRFVVFWLTKSAWRPCTSTSFEMMTLQVFHNLLVGRNITVIYFHSREHK